MAEFKKLSDVNVIESMKEGLNVLVEDGGEIVKLAAESLVPETTDLTGVVKSVNGIVPNELGDVQVPGLPEITELDEGKVLSVLGGNWVAVENNAFPSSEEFDQILMDKDKIIFNNICAFMQISATGYTDRYMLDRNNTDFKELDASEIVPGDTYRVKIGGWSEAFTMGDNNKIGYTEGFTGSYTGSEYFTMEFNVGWPSEIAEISGLFTNATNSSSKVIVIHCAHPMAFKDSVDGKTYYLKRNSTTGAVAAFDTL